MEPDNIASNTPKTLAEIFEEHRIANLRTGYSILGFNPNHQAETYIDKADIEELPEAADAIILAHAARMAVKSVARLENAYNERVRQNWGRNFNDAVLLELYVERDRAVGFYQQARERKARIEHLEDLARRSKVIPFPSKTRLPRAKLKKVETA